MGMGKQEGKLDQKAHGTHRKLNKTHRIVHGVTVLHFNSE